MEKIADIDYSHPSSTVNLVVDFLKRHGCTQAPQTPLTGGEHELASTSIKAPPSNSHYSASSGDTNPIHVNPFLAQLASLPGTIVHGMWYSAAIRAKVEKHVAHSCPDRIVK